MPDHIDPSAIPGDNLRPDMVEIAAGEIKTIGDDVSDQGGVVVGTWQRLANHYEAPEAGTLFGVMDPVKTNAETFGNNVDRVSSALSTYAAEVEPIKAELAKIKAEAYAFVASIAGGVEKTTFSRAGAIKTTVDWHEDQDSVDANNDLIRRVNAQMVLLWEAERKCANAIYDIIGFPHIEAASEDNPNGYGLTEIPDGTETPWGQTVERSESCGEKAVGAVGRFVWDGVIVGGIWGTVEGLGTLVLGYNPQTGEWFDGDAYGAAWSNLGKLAVGLAVTSPLTAPLVAAMPGPAGNFLRDCQMTVVNAGKGLIAWDKWKDDPAAAAGEATFNVASIIVPVGAATAPVRTSASTAAAAIRTAAKILDVVDPASALIKVGTAGARVAIPAISDLVKSIDLSKLDLGNLDAAGKIDIPESPKIDAPKVEVPAVSQSDMTLDTPNTASTADVPVRTVDTAATVPVREPALVGSGGDSTVHVGGGGHSGSGGLGGVGDGGHVGGGHTGGGHLGDGGHTSGAGGSQGTNGASAPPAGGGGGTDGPTHGPTGGSSHGAGNEWDPTQGDPVLSGADHGPGFVRNERLLGDPIDPDYGQSVANHGRLNDAYLPPKLDDVPQQVRELVTDPDAPFGRDAANRPYTREEWEARYVDENNELRYPGNEGAVPKRRLDFTDVEEFKAHYGDILDRFGGENGKYFSPDGTPFEARALPPGSLGQPYVRMRLGDLPPNWKIEVSEVAPAFGREGGGMQIRILDNNGQAVTMAELRKQGIVQKIDDSRWPADHPRPKGSPTPHYRNWNSGP
ncbi:MAG TPA: TNT domain-containing protein [Propionibacteriaceae bacterium]|nr:TNT domain-containing protein [Propionibacteriaceae bacterium]